MTTKFILISKIFQQAWDNGDNGWGHLNGIWSPKVQNWRQGRCGMPCAYMWGMRELQRRSWVLLPQTSLHLQQCGSRRIRHLRWILNQIVVDEHYTIRVHDNMPLDSAAPLLCAGITVYSPMQYFGLNRPGLHLGVVGLVALATLLSSLGRLLGWRSQSSANRLTRRERQLNAWGTMHFWSSTMKNKWRYYRDKHCICFLHSILIVLYFNIIFACRQQSVAWMV